MTSLLNYAEQVKSIVENADRYVQLTLEQLNALYTYQFSQPTSPKPGFVYKREFWRVPGDDKLWHGTSEAHIRYAISVPKYDGPLESTWFVFTCEADPKDDRYVVHTPKEVKVI